MDAGELAQLDDPRLVWLYRLGSEILESDAGDDGLLREAADILASLLEQVYVARELIPDKLTGDDRPLTCWTRSPSSPTRRRSG